MKQDVRSPTETGDTKTLVLLDLGSFNAGGIFNVRGPVDLGPGLGLLTNLSAA
jgi:hypothetical protein